MDRKRLQTVVTFIWFETQNPFNKTNFLLSIQDGKSLTPIPSLIQTGQKYILKFQDSFERWLWDNFEKEDNRNFMVPTKAMQLILTENTGGKILFLVLKKTFFGVDQKELDYAKLFFVLLFFVTTFI